MVGITGGDKKLAGKEVVGRMRRYKNQRNKGGRSKDKSQGGGRHRFRKEECKKAGPLESTEEEEAE